MKKSNQKGINLLETMIVISIIVVLAAIIMPSLSRYRAEQSLRNTTEDIISLLNTARNNTISSLNSTNYSVRFESNRAVLFIGSTFTEPNTSNVTLNYDPSVNTPVSGGINLNGGGSNVTFARLTGDTNDYGTIIIRLTSDSTRQKTITINKTGVVSAN